MSPATTSSNTESLRKNVKLLGRLLGEIISEAEGEAFYETVEAIRRLSKSARAKNDFEDLQHLLSPISNEKALGVARAFGQFLTLANIADQHHSTSLEHGQNPAAILRETVSKLENTKASKHALENALDKLKIDLVLTAHPTEIIRRTMINKYAEIDQCLGLLAHENNTTEQVKLVSRLRSLITQIWYSRDFRVNRPSPIDEAKGGYAVVERSLWQAVPDFLRELDAMREQLGLPAAKLDWTPVKFSSWMGGDRDGNPNVTAAITQETLLLSQWQAADLFSQDLNTLIEELSVTECNQDVRDHVGNAHEPYRTLLRPLRDRLETQRTELMHAIKDDKAPPAPLTKAQLLEPLELTYKSLHDCGMGIIAKGLLLDVIRRVHAFGPHLVTLDVRQESGRHSQAIAEIVAALGLGDYEQWSESERCEFLLRELNNPRPLLPRTFEGSADVREVLQTTRVIANHPREAFGAYVISMASSASDVLSVYLLMKEAGCQSMLPVAPLFETLSDLQNAQSVVQQLLELDGFCDFIQHQMMVMIGYSDSAKDAGVLAASWAQYQAQESLIQTCQAKGVALTLFHGRGGTIGRGGAPAQAALLSQPPGSLAQGLRVTEQGEMIRTKLGLPALAGNTLALYSSAILQANVAPPPQPQQEWRDLMHKLAESSCRYYRNYVRHNPDFLEYFREATPEQELANLPLGSRPARRRSGGGIETLRAIPWIFAWSQNRLLLPAWLGAGQALTEATQEVGCQPIIQQMITDWPFFKTRISMLEMVFAKADLLIAEYYDDTLVSPDYLPIGVALRQQLQQDAATVLALLDQGQLLQHDEWGKESIRLRNIYTAPLNLLQAELLRRERNQNDAVVEQAIMVSIAGVAAGMRNTG